MTTITTLPVAPSRADPSTFSTKADALLGALAGFVSEANLVAGEVNTNNTSSSTNATSATNSATSATNSALSASNSAAAAATNAGASIWVSGTTYAVGEARYSPTNIQVFRRIIAGAGTVDPFLDNVNWSPAIPSNSGSNIFLSNNFGGF